jgi:hypothetical protein
MLFVNGDIKFVPQPPLVGIGAGATNFEASCRLKDKSSRFRSTRLVGIECCDVRSTYPECEMLAYAAFRSNFHLTVMEALGWRT